MPRRGISLQAAKVSLQQNAGRKISVDDWCKMNTKYGLLTTIVYTPKPYALDRLNNRVMHEQRVAVFRDRSKMSDVILGTEFKDA